MLQRLLDPTVLSNISGLELVAKTVVDGFVAGLHRSPNFGFSQEFAEYRAYNEGDDLRHVDWNVFARSDRMYLKRYRGETNTQLTMLLDVSASMTYGSQTVNKLDYTRYLAASIAYLSNQQRDAAGVVVFDDEIRNYVPPSTRQGQFMRILNAIGSAEGGTRTNYEKPFVHCQNFLRRRGVIVVISDFYADPQLVIKTMEPMRMHGNEMILFHVLDPQELRPSLKGPSLLVDLETNDEMEVSPDYAKGEYRQKVDAHLKAMKEGAQRSGIDYVLLDTSQPLDGALRQYLSVRQGRA